MDDEIAVLEEEEENVNVHDYVGTVFEYKGQLVRLIDMRDPYAVVRVVKGKDEQESTFQIPRKSALWWIKNHEEKLVESRLQDEIVRRKEVLARLSLGVTPPHQFSKGSAVQCTTDDKPLLGSWPFSADGKRRMMCGRAARVSDTDLVVKTGGTHEHRTPQLRCKPLPQGMLPQLPDNRSKEECRFRRGDVVLASNMRGVVVGVGTALLRVRFPTHTGWVQRSKVLKCGAMRGAQECNRHRRNFADMKQIIEEASQVPIRIGARVRVNGRVGAVVGYSAFNEAMVRNSDGTIVSMDVSNFESYDKERIQRLHEEGARKQERLQKRRKLHTHLRNEAEKRILDASVHPARDKVDAEKIAERRCGALFALATSSGTVPMHAQCKGTARSDAVPESRSPGTGKVFDRLYNEGVESAMRLNDKRMVEEIQAVNRTNSRHTRKPRVGWSWRTFGPDNYVALLERIQNLRTTQAERFDLEMKTQQVSFGIKPNPKVFVKLFQQKKVFTTMKKEPEAEDRPIAKRRPQRAIKPLPIACGGTRRPNRPAYRSITKCDAATCSPPASKPPLTSGSPVVSGSHPASGSRPVSASHLKKKSLQELKDSIERLTKPPKRNSGLMVVEQEKKKPAPKPVELYVDTMGVCTVVDEHGTEEKISEDLLLSDEVDELSTESEGTSSEESDAGNDPLRLLAYQMSKANPKTVPKKQPKKKKVKLKKRTLAEMMNWQKVAAAWMERFHSTHLKDMPLFHARREPGVSELDRQFVSTMRPVQHVQDAVAEQEAEEVANFNARRRENAMDLDEYNFEQNFHFKPRNSPQEKIARRKKVNEEHCRKREEATLSAHGFEPMTKRSPVTTSDPSFAPPRREGPVMTNARRFAPSTLAR